MWKWLRWILLAFGILILLAIFGLTKDYLSFHLPHQKPVLILPIDKKYDENFDIMPMGEKIYHPNAPSGHPGIDFGIGKLTEPVSYIAAMDGKVSSVKITKSDEKGGNGKDPITTKLADVIITNGPYQTRYGEMDADLLPAYIKIGAKIKQGDLVGYGNLSTDGSMPGTKTEMIHWEFGSQSPIIDRFCPLSYFTAESKARIEAIWARSQWPNKDQYPKICNGDYDDKLEPGYK
jgi:murein DD-endopeptidase MepM/ murein hydrolase activator NlpD